ncbi:MAG: UPF0033 protein YrkI [Thermomicrobiales bacterium]|nr:MAG: UPF0033 protein YrkI [Thermomicrobiales bacterium]
MTAELPHPDAVLEAPGLTCATLTPAIKERLRDLASGQVLEVRCDDPAAKEAVPSWSRLTGHSILATTEEPAGQIRFFIQHK